MPQRFGILVLVFFSSIMLVSCQKPVVNNADSKTSSDATTQIEKPRPRKTQHAAIPKGRIIVEINGEKAAFDIQSKSLSELSADEMKEASNQEMGLSVSKDGKYFARNSIYAADPRRIATVENSEEKQINVPYANFSEPWFLDDKVVFQNIDKIYTASFKDGVFSNPRSLINQGILESVAPDRKTILFVDRAEFGETNAYHLTDTSGQRIVSFGSDIFKYTYDAYKPDLVWSPDSNFVAYVRPSEENGVELRYKDIYIQKIRPDSGNQLPPAIRVTNQERDYEKTIKAWLP